ncbi:DUF4826 family protein [Alteromonas sp. CYL-A6]|uniref:DUF4826 family protein n=1 Tax=Alteromonas nitratireducens TaxID=3390813 RepID=UPI0034B12C27
MSEQSPSAQMTEEQKEAWIKEQFQRANKHLAENGVLFDTVVADASKYLIPYLSVWKIKSTENKQYWVISGDLPTDFMLASNAKDAREAIRHFSMSWQMKAESIRQTMPGDETQMRFAALLENKAMNLFNVHESEHLWRETH